LCAREGGDRGDGGEGRLKGGGGVTSGEVERSGRRTEGNVKVAGVLREGVRLAGGMKGA